MGSRTLTRPLQVDERLQPGLRGLGGPCGRRLTEHHGPHGGSAPLPHSAAGLQQTCPHPVPTPFPQPITQLSGCPGCVQVGRGLTMASSASSSFIRLSLRSSWERSAVAWSVASLAWRRSSHFSRSSRSFSFARALTASSLSCRDRAPGRYRGGVGPPLGGAIEALTPGPEEDEGGPWLCLSLAGGLD